MENLLQKYNFQFILFFFRPIRIWHALWRFRQPDVVFLSMPVRVRPHDARQYLQRKRAQVASADIYVGDSIERSQTTATPPVHSLSKFFFFLSKVNCFHYSSFILVEDRSLNLSSSTAQQDQSSDHAAVKTAVSCLSVPFPRQLPSRDVIKKKTFQNFSQNFS